MNNERARAKVALAFTTMLNNISYTAGKQKNMLEENFGEHGARKPDVEIDENNNIVMTLASQSGKRYPGIKITMQNDKLIITLRERVIEYNGEDIKTKSIVKNTDVSEENTVLDNFFSEGLIETILSVEEMCK